MQGDRLPDEQHPAGALPLVPLPAGAGGLGGRLWAAGLDGGSGAGRVGRAGHSRPRALRGLRGEWVPREWPRERCAVTGRNAGSREERRLQGWFLRWLAGAASGRLNVQLWGFFLSMYCFI